MTRHFHSVIKVFTCQDQNNLNQSLSALRSFLKLFILEWFYFSKNKTTTLIHIACHNLTWVVISYKLLSNEFKKMLSCKPLITVHVYKNDNEFFLLDNESTNISKRTSKTVYVQPFLPHIVLRVSEWHHIYCITSLNYINIQKHWKRATSCDKIIA